MSDYPDNYDFEKEGNARLEGKLISINNVQAKKYGTDEMVEKFVANIEDSDGTVWAVWLDSAVLNRAFRDEARNRKAIGQTFAPEERVIIEYLGKRQGATYRYKDFRVEFEFAAPSVSGFDALAGSVEPTQTADEQLDAVAAEAPAETGEAASEESPATPASDDIPF